jgi:hypothetical protein
MKKASRVRLAFFISVIPAQAGIQMIEQPPRSRTTSRFCPRCGMFFYWIPAFAGMTVLSIDYAAPMFSIK